MEKIMSKYAAKRAAKYQQLCEGVKRMPAPQKPESEDRAMAKAIEVICADLAESKAPWIPQAQTPKAPQPKQEQKPAKEIAAFLSKAVLRPEGKGIAKVLQEVGPRWTASVQALAEASIQLEVYTRYVHRTGERADKAHMASILEAAKSALSTAILEALIDRAEEEAVASEIADVPNISEAKGVMVTAFHYLLQTPVKGEKAQEAFLANAITSLFRVERELKTLKG